jgi:hypothetical protein
MCLYICVRLFTTQRIQENSERNRALIGPSSIINRALTPYMCPHTDVCVCVCVRLFTTRRIQIIQNAEEQVFKALLRRYQGSIKALLRRYEGPIKALLRLY